MLDTFSNAFGTIIAQIILSIVIYILKMSQHKGTSFLKYTLLAIVF